MSDETRCSKYQAKSRHLLVSLPFNFKIVAYKTSSWVFILHRKNWNAHNYIKHHLPRQMIPDISRYHASSRQLLVPFDYQYTILSKFWDIKRVAEYLFCTGRNGIRIIISSIICHVR